MYMSMWNHTHNYILLTNFANLDMSAPCDSR